MLNGLIICHTRPSSLNQIQHSITMCSTLYNAGNFPKSNTVKLVY